MKNQKKFQEIIGELRSRWLVSFDGDLDTGKTARSLINAYDFCKPIKTKDGELAEDVSLIDDIDVVEEEFWNARSDEYEIASDQISNLQNDIESIKEGFVPKSLRLVAYHDKWDLSPHLLQNIRRFRWYNKPQTIIVRVKPGRWISLRLKAGGSNKRDSIAIADSAYREGAEYVREISEILIRIYSIFKLYRLPAPDDILPPLE